MNSNQTIQDSSISYGTRNTVWLVHKHIDKLVQYVVDGKVKLDDIITHHLPLSKIEHAYDIFSKRTDGCVKIILDPWI